MLTIDHLKGLQSQKEDSTRLQERAPSPWVDRLPFLQLH